MIKENHITCPNCGDFCTHFTEVNIISSEEDNVVHTQKGITNISNIGRDYGSRDKIIIKMWCEQCCFYEDKEGNPLFDRERGVFFFEILQRKGITHLTLKKTITQH